MILTIMKQTSKSFQPRYLKIALGVYIVISLGYMAVTQWNNFKTNYIEKSYTQGQRDTIAQLLTQANDEECKSFAVYLDTTQVELINVNCVQNQAATTEPAAN
jgi:hypothetical protein